MTFAPHCGRPRQPHYSGLTAVPATAAAAGATAARTTRRAAGDRTVSAGFAV
jgi:hypothetical protein